MSSKLTDVLNSLPLEAQQIFVDKHLAGLLDRVPKDKLKTALSTATRLQKKYKEAPTLDLRSKRKQITALIDELNHDAKVSFVKERSNRDELLSEALHSLVGWLNDIWSVVYEHNVNFRIAHSCLVFVADALDQLSERSTLGGCKCSVINLPVNFTLRDKSGKIIKRFSVVGPQNVDRILLWIWRDLFVCLLASASEQDKRRIPDFLEDIESVLGVAALERLLYGGRPSNDDEDEDEDEDKDYEDVDSEEDDEYQSCVDDDSDYGSDVSGRCSCNLHARYWTENVNKERTPLKELVENRLIAIFKVAPSLQIYNSLLAISNYVMASETIVYKLLADIAGDTPDNLVAALDIHIANGDSTKIVTLLNQYSYLLRARDTATLQCAVAMLGHSSYRSQSLAILEKELTDCVRAIYTTVGTCFSHIEDDANKKDLLEVLKLRNSSSTRHDRIQQWVDRVITPSNGPIHPMAFAAMMMGLPMLPGSDDGEDADLLEYVDLDHEDPDLDDLREELRPNLKGKFDGWVHLAQTMKGGGGILAKLYVKAIDLMPWLRSSDIVTEMTNKLRDRPNKTHILDVLTNLSSFAKTQRKRFNQARAEQQRRSANTTQTCATINQSPGRSSSSASNSSPPVLSTTTTMTGAPDVLGNSQSASFPPVPGGIEDVD